MEAVPPLGGAIGVRHVGCTVRQVHSVCRQAVRPSPCLSSPGGPVVCRGRCRVRWGISGGGLWPRPRGLRAMGNPSGLGQAASEPLVPCSAPQPPAYGGAHAPGPRGVVGGRSGERHQLDSIDQGDPPAPQQGLYLVPDLGHREGGGGAWVPLPAAACRSESRWPQGPGLGPRAFP